MIRNCSNCALQYKESCPYPLGNHSSCEKFVPREEPVYQPPNNAGRSKPSPGEYRGEPSKKIKRTGFLPKHKDTRPVKLYNGQKLYYRNRFNGRIEYGIVFQTSRNSFWFKFNGKETKLSYSVVGERLFFSKKGVIKNNKA